MAAFCLAVAVAVAIWGTLKPKAFAAISAEETGNFASQRFLSEADLWRVHVRSLHALDHATANAQDAVNSGARAVEKSFWAFLVGLAF